MYHFKTTALTAAYTHDVEDLAATTHQISFTKNGGDAGTLGIQVMPLGTDCFETLTDANGNAVSISMAANSTFGPFDGLFAAIKVTPTGFNGTNFTLTFAGA